MDSVMALGDPLRSLLIWVSLAFLLWLMLTVLIRPLGVQAVVMTASASWIVARLFLWFLPVILHRVEAWFGS